MIREFIKPKQNKISIDIPDDYINKKLELLIFPIDKVNVKKKKKISNIGRLMDNNFKAARFTSVSSNVDIDKLMNEMNNALPWYEYFDIRLCQSRFRKNGKSQQLIKELANSGNLLLSPLSLQELIFTLSKLDIDKDHIESNYELFSNFCQYSIDKSLLDSAFKICIQIDFCKNINDIIHIKFAEKYCDAFSTYDHDFKRLEQIADIDIKIL